MKRKIYSILMLAASLTMGLTACEDEVLVETKDDTKVNEILAEIAAADEQFATLSLENNTLTVSNEAAEKAIAELAELQDELTDPNSEPTEVHYTVTVLSSSNSVVTSANNGGGSRIKGVDGAEVVVEQNGLVLEPSSSSNGLYLFTGLKTGYIYVRASAANHTSVEYRAYIYKEDGDDAASAKSFNAQTQIVLYPNAGDKAGKYTGMAYANTTVLNDTLNRKYGSGAAFGTKANTYIAAPKNNFYDYTYYWDNVGGLSGYNMYGTYVGGNNYVAQYENAPAGQKIYAYPVVAQFANNNSFDATSENGEVFEIIYKGVVTSTTVGADGTFTLPVVSSGQYNSEGSELVDRIQIQGETYVAPHTRFTTWGGNYYGQTDETGSVEVTLSYYNNTNGSISPYTGTGVTQVLIPPAQAENVKRRVITEDWVYFAQEVSTEDILQAGETRNVNIYFAPRDRD